MSEQIWKVVAEVNGILEAKTLIGRLQTEDIPAQMEEIGPVSAFPMTVGRLGMVRIYVPEAFMEQALGIVDYDYSDDLDEAFDSFDDDDGETYEYDDDDDDLES